MKVTPQAMICILSYSTIATMLFLPSLSYDDVSFKTRFYWFLMIIVGGACIATSMNCMITGNCMAWSWVLVIALCLMPTFFGLLYVLNSKDTVAVYNKLKEALDIIDGDGDGDGDDK